jgi:hypothetical protein
MPVLVRIDPAHPCDRCGHRSDKHAPPEQGSACRFVEGSSYSAFRKHAHITAKAQQCWCDGYFPKP